MIELFYYGSIFCIMIILSALMIKILYECIVEKQEINKKIIQQNQEQKILNETLSNEIKEKIHTKDSLKELISQLDDTYNQKKQNIKKHIKELEEISFSAFENYMDTLEGDYVNVNQSYDNKIADLEKSFTEKKDLLNLQLDKERQKINQQLEEENKKIQEIKNFRIAAQQAITREKEIKEKQNFYCLTIDEKDKNDIAILERIKPQLAKPRVLSMLIWSTWFQKPMTTLCNNILGIKQVTGIYKITNIITNECYVGQALDVASRLKTHAKCGLGIDTPAGNKLYKAMQEYGIWNFSWELLEQCDKSQLNERERYYIDLYMSKDYGYNSNKGVNI